MNVNWGLCLFQFVFKIYFKYILIHLYIQIYILKYFLNFMLKRTLHNQEKQPSPSRGASLTPEGEQGSPTVLSVFWYRQENLYEVISTTCFFWNDYPQICLFPLKSLSRVQLFATPWTVAYQAPPCMGFSRPEYWSRLPFPSPGDLPTQESNPGLPHCRQRLYCLSHQGSSE